MVKILHVIGSMFSLIFYIRKLFQVKIFLLLSPTLKMYRDVPSNNQMFL